MGRKDKHKLGASRNNAVYKVVGAKVSKGAKGKPREVAPKLKKVGYQVDVMRSVHSTPKLFQLSAKAKEDKLASLDAQLVALQHGGVKMAGSEAKAKMPTKITPVGQMRATKAVTDVEMDSVIKGMEKANGATAKT